MNSHPPRWSRWLWDGPRIEVAIASETTFARGRVFNVWSRGLSVELLADAPESFDVGADVRLEVPLPSGQGIVMTEARIRRCGTGEFARFLTVEWFDAINLIDPNHEALVAEFARANRDGAASAPLRAS